MAAWVQGMFWNFYLEKKCKNAYDSVTTEARDENKQILESLILLNNYVYVLLILKTINFYLIKLATYFEWQLSYLLGEASQLETVAYYSISD